jgi:peptidase E
MFRLAKKPSLGQLQSLNHVHNEVCVHYGMAIIKIHASQAKTIKSSEMLCQYLLQQTIYPIVCTYAIMYVIKWL